MTNHIDRREAIKRVSVLLGGAALIGGSGLITACAGDRPPSPDAPTAKPIGNFSVDDQRFLDEVADTILPTTAKSPGAKAAATGPFMALMVTDQFVPEDQTIFRTGLRTIDDNCRAAHNVGFMQATPEQRTAVLTALDKEQHEYQRNKTREEPTHFFRMMKEQALVGFFTSEIGYTQAMRYKETPGEYQPCVPYVKGETIWASHA
ncbi:MAG: gluconate 2-dehydrogenase subunit 3 family protein [Gemmatimonadaceae bacterium]|nr:gluconate 2-dehydrogenase subunit 3 family protein [Gemmatimonadaceae bacterium]